MDRISKKIAEKAVSVGRACRIPEIRDYIGNTIRNLRSQGITHEKAMLDIAAKQGLIFHYLWHEKEIFGPDINRLKKLLTTKPDKEIIVKLIYDAFDAYYDGMGRDEFKKFKLSQNQQLYFMMEVLTSEPTYDITHSISPEDLLLKRDQLCEKYPEQVMTKAQWDEAQAFRDVQGWTHPVSLAPPGTYMAVGPESVFYDQQRRRGIMEYPPPYGGKKSRKHKSRKHKSRKHKTRKHKTRKHRK